MLILLCCRLCNLRDRRWVRVITLKYLSCRLVCSSSWIGLLCYDEQERGNDEMKSDDLQ